ncbi:MAG: alkaline phosphatase family protein [Alphaproteobacteria bacterium]|nr:alkaline phosphatase family protein [Alphaproteobacteria bacterium]MDE2014275.1 phosphoesterase [Alphaproteobacteria bacterium]MDE2352289.1 phosphoesterase [Alphaproteobacteria bacterium]
MRIRLRHLAVLAAVLGAVPSAGRAAPVSPIKHVFVIAFENHNWTQPASDDAAPRQIFRNSAAPYINGLVTPGNPNSAQVSFAAAYHNVGATADGETIDIHPSEPSYIWSEAGSNLGVFTDDDPLGLGGTEQRTKLTLSNLLQRAGKSWRSYQEDVNIDYTDNRGLPRAQWTVPFHTRVGVFAQGINAYNGSRQYGYAPKHNPQVLFAVTNGNGNQTAANPMADHYAPLQQLAADLASGNLADYTWITPDLYNDMHTALDAGFTYHGVHYTGDQAAIAEGDNFASRIVPVIMASKAYKDGGLIILWWDETEGRNLDDYQHTIPEIIISPYAKGHAFMTSLNYSHSSDLVTMEEIFGLKPCLRDACKANDLSDLFKPGTIPQSLP